MRLSDREPYLVALCYRSSRAPHFMLSCLADRSPAAKNLSAILSRNELELATAFLLPEKRRKQSPTGCWTMSYPAVQSKTTPVPQHG